MSFHIRRKSIFSHVLIPMSELKKGDAIRVRTGSVIPVDGEICGGEAYINEASMTDEPLAVMKSEGATVFARTVVEEGSLRILQRRPQILPSAEQIELVRLRKLSELLMERIHKNYRFILLFNSALLLSGLGGIISPSLSAFLHNASTMAICGKSMTKLIDT